MTFGLETEWKEVKEEGSK